MYYLTGIINILSTAEFFFQKIRENISQPELIHYLFGFTVATKSIPDHLLHDYYVRFFGNIPKDRIELMIVEPEYLNENVFEKKAKKSGHKKALNFIKHYNKKIKEFREMDKKTGFLFKMRNITTHRKIASRPHYSTIRIREGKTEEICGLEKRDEDIKLPDLISFCEYCLNEMKSFVDETKYEFK